MQSNDNQKKGLCVRTETFKLIFFKSQCSKTFCGSGKTNIHAYQVVASFRHLVNKNVHTRLQRNYCNGICLDFN